MSRINFHVNGIPCSVGSEIRSDVMLVDYIRIFLNLRGTKFMCRGAGCGGCIVSVVIVPGGPVLAVNSCMVSVFSCNGWLITTVEHIGNKLKGYHPVQETLAKCNGTQCGHCTPGWVMAFYSLLKKNPDIRMLEIEKSLSSNICRCTGYRSILEAFKQFGKDCPKSVLDIEDMSICGISRNNSEKKSRKIVFNDDTVPYKSEKDIKEEENTDINKILDDWCYIAENIQIKLKDDKTWYKVDDLNTVLDLINGKSLDSYMLVAGNTGKGVCSITDYPDMLIDISEMKALKGYNIDQNLIIGAGETLTNLLEILKTVAKKEYFTYLTKLCDHIELVAHIPLRNICTLGGNLMIKHKEPKFASDIFLLLNTIRAQVTILSAFGEQDVSMEKFLSIDMAGKILVAVKLPPMSNRHKLVTYKIMPRSQSATAHVNAGLLCKLDSDNKVLSASIAFGNLCPTFHRCSNTEKYLLGKDLFTNETIQGALTIMDKELEVVEMLPKACVAYRKQLALQLFYKGVLTLCLKMPNNVNPRFYSGIARVYEEREVSKATQVYDTNPLVWPLTQPTSKLEALLQCAGEATFTEDLPSLPNEVFAAFVLSTTGSGYIHKIDATKALKYTGVVAFFTADDIPGVNSFTPNNETLYKSYEKILCEDKVEYYSQPLGIIVGETQEIANKAAKLVEVSYKNTQRPVTDIKEAIKYESRNTLYKSVSASSSPGRDVKKIFKDTFYSDSQFHFTMETIVCVSQPTEEGLKVYATTQWVTGVQKMISLALKMDSSRIDVHVKRIGGGYGAKISRSTQAIIACCLVTHKLNRPCRFIQPVTTNMKAMGKRLPTCAKYEVGVNSSGEVQYCNLNIYEDNGCIIDEDFYALVDTVNNCYKCDTWSYSLFNTTTDTASNTWCRSPGTMEVTAFTEFMMDRIAYGCSLDPIDVRLANIDESYRSDIEEIITTLKQNSDYDTRKAEINSYNSSNRWTKRALRMGLLRWTPISLGIFGFNMSVYSDGTVCISHGGIEMGQGINTKVVQVCAYLLKISVEKIQVKETSSIFAPNSMMSGASVTSESICMAAHKCCDTLLSRLKSAKDAIDSQVWEDIITKAIEMNINLHVNEIYNSTTDFSSYDVFGAAAVEVQVDILTGESVIKRVDIIEDLGESVSPMVDVGQVEGAFIMGVGHWTMEGVVYDPDTGEVLTESPLTYHVPLARDIPEVFRLYFRKNSSGPVGTFGSKCVGEPPICLSITVLLAIIEAVTAARLDAGIPTTQFAGMNKGDAETICTTSGTKLEHLILY